MFERKGTLNCFDSQVLFEFFFVSRWSPCTGCQFLWKLARNFERTGQLDFYDWEWHLVLISSWKGEDINASSHDFFVILGLFCLSLNHAFHYEKLSPQIKFLKARLQRNSIYKFECAPFSSRCLLSKLLVVFQASDSTKGIPSRWIAYGRAKKSMQ